MPPVHSKSPNSFKKKHLTEYSSQKDREVDPDEDIAGTHGDKGEGYAMGGNVGCSNCHGTGCYECKDPVKMMAEGGPVKAWDDETMQPASQPSPTPASGSGSAEDDAKKNIASHFMAMAEGGEVDDEEMVDAPLLDDEMKEKLGKELSECMKSGNHRGILDCIEAIVHSLK
jgi:hypothetical protein